MKAHALKRDLSDIKNSMSEINNLATIGRTTTPTSISDMKMSNNSAMSQLQQRYLKFLFVFIFIFFYARKIKKYFLFTFTKASKINH